MVTQRWTGAWASPSSLLKPQTARLLIPADASSPGCVCAQGSHNAFKKTIMPVAEEVSMPSLSKTAGTLGAGAHPWEMQIGTPCGRGGSAGWVFHMSAVGALTPLDTAP